jgi:hypothetical protein
MPVPRVLPAPKGMIVKDFGTMKEIRAMRAKNLRAAKKLHDHGAFRPPL